MLSSGRPDAPTKWSFIDCNRRLARMCIRGFASFVAFYIPFVQGSCDQTALVVVLAFIADITRTAGFARISLHGH